MTRSTHALIRFCNVRQPGRTGLGVIDLQTLDYKGLDIDLELPASVGITGLAVSDDYVFAVAQATSDVSASGDGPRPSVLLTLDRRDLSVVGRYTFKVARDVHSIMLEGTILHVASPGTDEIVRLELDGPGVRSESAVWRVDGSDGKDTNHVNSICRWNGHIVVSAFGPKSKDSWVGASQGFVVDTTAGRVLAEGLRHPHSVLPSEGRLLFCESERNAIREGTRVLATLPGYSRGLCQVGDKLLAATSRRRMVSRSTGIAMPQEEAGACVIAEISADAFALERVVDLGTYNDEIFDVLPIFGVADWRTRDA